MVHGTYYGIQYEVKLTKDIDFYNDLLPIWIETRARIEIQKDIKTNNYKLIIIPYNEFYKQLSENSLFTCYVRENNSVSYSKPTLTEQYLRSNKFAIVRQYEKLIRNKTSLPEPITIEEYTKLSDKMQKLKQIDLVGKNMSEDEWRKFDKEYDEIYIQLQIQRIIHNPEYFDEIKNLHKQLLEQVTFDEEQRERIQKVISHTKLNGIISWHGLTLVDGFY
jgi:hypothetical protein